MPVPKQFADRYAAMCAAIASHERLPLEAIQWRMELWPAAVCVFLMLRWEHAGHEGFQGSHRLLDLLKNLDCTITGLNWLADQTHVGVRGRRASDREFDLILPAAALDLDREGLARLLKTKLSVDAKTRAISLVRPGTPVVEGRGRRSLPNTGAYRRAAGPSGQGDPANSGGKDSPK